MKIIDKQSDWEWLAIKTPGLRRKLWESQNGRCKGFWKIPDCNADLSETGSHFDHIIPRSKGGTHDESNLQLLCPRCNIKKSNHLPPLTATQLQTQHG